MKRMLLKNLAQLASRSYQYDYIVHSTQDEYVIPEEMVDSVRTTVLEALRNPSSLTDAQIALLTALEKLIKAAYDVVFDHDRYSVSTMIDGKEWSEMRDCANRCLLEMGIREDELKGLLIDA